MQSPSAFICHIPPLGLIGFHEVVVMPYTVKESDWKLFRSRIGGWQDNYMERLCKEYIEMLSQNTPPADRFWEMVKRLKRDKRKHGVICEMTRSSMMSTILALIRETAITLSDLDDFSEELKQEACYWTNVRS